MPNGSTVHAEAAIEYQEMLRGLMFRDKLPADEGMLFFHNKAGKYPYWMYQVQIPLDIIWVDAKKNVVEVVAGAKPCESKKASECPAYGGTVEAQFVLEVGAGLAAKNGVTVGSKLNF